MNIKLIIDIISALIIWIGGSYLIVMFLKKGREWYRKDGWEYKYGSYIGLFWMLFIFILFTVQCLSMAILYL